jgi:hypothetical protein
MNDTALRQASRVWRETLGVLGFLRQAFLRRAGEEGVGLEFLFQLSRGGCVLPAYLFHRAAQPVANGELPVSIAVLYKTLLGVSLTTGRGLQYQLITGAPVVRCTPADLLAFTEQERLFINQKGEACAAPSGLVAELFERMIHGFEPVPADAATLTALLPDLDAFLSYADQSLKLLLTTELLGILFRPLAAALRRAVASEATEGGEQSSEAMLSPAQKARLMEGILRTIEQLDRRSLRVLAAALRSLTSEPSPSWLERAAREISSRAPGGASEAPLVHELLKYLALERKALIHLKGLEDDLNGALGRPPRPEMPDVSVIAGGLGGKVRRKLFARLGITFETGAEHTLVRSGSEAYAL